MSTSLIDIVQAGSLPERAEDIIPLLTNESGEFLNQEGTIWDFKANWPEHCSGQYFHSICRLICAFMNTEGGLIIFGVDDKTRLPVRNLLSPDLDKLELAFRDITGINPRIQHRRYSVINSGKIDVLLVCRKTARDRPVRFISPVSNYPKDTIYVRNGSRVVPATSLDITNLYLRTQEDDPSDVPRGQLPPSPSTVKEFVGRMDAIDRIFNWLAQEDEPRAFLYGKGGSGKSTIAYQVYKSIKISGSGFFIAGNQLERLIYISAKARYLDINAKSALPFAGLDFSNEIELYQAILSLGEHELDNSKIDDVDYLRKEAKVFFDSSSVFIVIDDIDTLSTANIDTGMDYLFGLLWRSKKRSKILYTLRNRPTQSISSSLEIPGLNGQEFEHFVRVCSEQFKVPEPSSGVRDTMILPVSEGRPLVVESIIALRRTSGNYPDAVKIFESEAGDEVRDYVFKREWDSLDKTDRGREILTILALYNKPIVVDDLITISRMDASKVLDALAAIQEIFLNIENNGEETRYSIGSLTRRFVIAAGKNLNLYETIKARVENFKNTFYADSPEINRLYARFHRSFAAFKNGEERYLERFPLIPVHTRTN